MKNTKQDIGLLKIQVITILIVSYLTLLLLLIMIHRQRKLDKGALILGQTINAICLQLESWLKIGLLA